jgi:hypothetical protein
MVGRSLTPTFSTGVTPVYATLHGTRGFADIAKFIVIVIILGYLMTQYNYMNLEFGEGKLQYVLRYQKEK